MVESKCYTARTVGALRELLTDIPDEAAFGPDPLLFWLEGNTVMLDFIEVEASEEIDKVFAIV